MALRRPCNANDDDDEVVRDGEVVRTSVFMRDSAPRTRVFRARVFRDDDGEFEVTDAQADLIRDTRAALAFGLDDADQLHRPGFRFCDDAANEAKAKAYLQAVQDAENAYRTPPAEPPSAVGGFSKLTESRGGRVGDPCTCRGPEYPLDFGSPGHLEERDGNLVCVPDNPREDSQSKMDARDAAYLEYCRELSEAWRGK